MRVRRSTDSGSLLTLEKGLGIHHHSLKAKAKVQMGSGHPPTPAGKPDNIPGRQGLSLLCKSAGKVHVDRYHTSPVVKIYALTGVVVFSRKDHRTVSGGPDGIAFGSPVVHSPVGSAGLVVEDPPETVWTGNFTRDGTD